MCRSATRHSVRPVIRRAAAPHVIARVRVPLAPTRFVLPHKSRAEHTLGAADSGQGAASGHATVLEPAPNPHAPAPRLGLSFLF